MQTAAIAYRVADFLKQHPPFQFMDEPDLVALAARGRVRFHEPDEYVCWQSSPHTPFLLVIQQGAVSLWDETADPPALRDIRGAGDSIGIERFNGAAVSPYSAKTGSEVVVYALPAAEIEPLLQRYPRAAQYVAAYSAVTAGYAKPGGEHLAPHEMRLGEVLRGAAPLPRCAPETSIQDAAGLLLASGAHALALVAESGEQPLAGLLTAADLVGWVAAGAGDARQPATSIAQAPAVTLGPQAMVSEAVLLMSEMRASAAALTEDGSPGAPVRQVVTAASLAPAFGDHPSAIIQEMERAATIEAIRGLHARARAWILAQLTAPGAMDWLANWADLVNRRIFERILQITGLAHDTAAGGDDVLYCFYGAAGRRELLTSGAPSIAVVVGGGGGAPPDGLEAALAGCGFLAAEPALVQGSLAEWKSRFSGWVRDPVRNELYRSRPFFDLRPVHGPPALFAELEAHLRAEMADEPVFLRILANDCLSSLPPLTFFRDLVVEESGERTDTFRLDSSTLQPLADVARVFGLAAAGGGDGALLGASTRERFERAGRLLPGREPIFREAAETMQIVLFHQARAGLRFGSSGAEIPLSLLSRHDRQVLKSGFRSIHQLLEFTVPGDWLEDGL